MDASDLAAGVGEAAPKPFELTAAHIVVMVITMAHALGIALWIFVFTATDDSASLLHSLPFRRYTGLSQDTDTDPCMFFSALPHGVTGKPSAAARPSAPAATSSAPAAASSASASASNASAAASNADAAPVEAKKTK